MAIVKNDDKLFDIVCDSCGSTQADIEGEASYDTFMEAVEYKKANKDLWHSVKNQNTDEWADLCDECYKDKETYNSFKGR